jgi:hypothetical protein
MLSEKDIYEYLKYGGSIRDLYAALDKEIIAANKRIKEEKEAEQRKMETAEKIHKAREHAFKALKSYFALVNPEITDEIINAVFCVLEVPENSF